MNRSTGSQHSCKMRASPLSARAWGIAMRRLGWPADASARAREGSNAVAGPGQLPRDRHSLGDLR